MRVKVPLILILYIFRQGNDCTMNNAERNYMFYVITSIFREYNKNISHLSFINFRLYFWYTSNFDTQKYNYFNMLR